MIQIAMSETNMNDLNPLTYTVPRRRIVSIEHPCIVKNLDNGLKSLGGEPQLKDVSAVHLPDIR